MCLQPAPRASQKADCRSAASLTPTRRASSAIKWPGHAPRRRRWRSVAWRSCARPLSRVFVSYICGTPACSSVLDVDGIEFGLLRRTPGLAYGHCLLYAWQDLMTAGSGKVKWWRFWLSAYKK